MAEMDFESDLRSMFGQAPPAQDAAAFALAVDRRLMRGLWMRAALVVALGFAGLVIAWTMFGFSLADLAPLGGAAQWAQAQGAGNLGLWAVAALALALVLSSLQSVLSEA